jgi:hypothetical protein
MFYKFALVFHASAAIAAAAVAAVTLRASCWQMVLIRRQAPMMAASRCWRLLRRASLK